MHHYDFTETSEREPFAVTPAALHKSPLIIPPPSFHSHDSEGTASAAPLFTFARVVDVDED